MRATVSLAVVIAALVLGCSDSDEETAPIHEPSTCAPGGWVRDDGVCVPAGLPPDMPCPPAEWLRDGICIPAGVPPDGCGQGFVHDGDRGCDALLPSAPCPVGHMAVPGEMTCREVAPCAPGKWGDIPVESNTQYVDANYAAMDSDGSQLKPWTSIQNGIDAAAPGAIVAIAAGSYPEDVSVSGKPVRIWGVCPALVEVVGPDAASTAVEILTGAAATEVRNLAIRGGTWGIVSTGSLDVLIERLWVHDNAGRGLVVQNSYGPSSVTLRASLFEQNHEVGVYNYGSGLTVEASVVRTTQLNALQRFGRGVVAENNPATSQPTTLVIESSLVEQNHDHGVFVSGTQATVEASVVRATQPDGQGLFGRGVSVHTDPTTGLPSALLLKSSLVDENHDAGVGMDGSATVEASVIRATQPDGQGAFGRGVSVQPPHALGPSPTLELRRSLVEQSHELGVHVWGSEATLEASAVRATQPGAGGIFGRGVSAQSHPATGPSTLVLLSSLIEQSHEGGLALKGTNATVEASVVRATLPTTHGFAGCGVYIGADSTSGAPTTLLLKSSLVEQNHVAGVLAIDSVATIESSLILDTAASEANGSFGDGVNLLSQLGSASVIVTATRIERSARAALAAHGAHARVGGSILSCQLFDLDRETGGGKAATLDDLGNNLCGCPEATERCKAVSANLEPPTQLEPLPGSQN